MALLNKEKNNKKNSKQNIVQNKKLINTKKRKKQIICICSSIILLALILFGVLKISSNIKSGSKEMIDQFYKFYKSQNSKIVLYYDSTIDDNEAYFELEYLLNISKQYDLEYTSIDLSKISKKNDDKIKSLLGIEGISPSIIVVKNEQVVVQQEGFIESHKLIDLLKSAKVLKEDAKYKSVDNLKFITYSDYMDILKNDETNIVVVGQSACQYCNRVKPILNNISKAYKIIVNYYNVNDSSVEELKEFFSELPELGYDNDELTDNDTFYMPTVLIIKDGKIISYLENEKSLEEYITYFKEQDIIE